MKIKVDNREDSKRIKSCVKFYTSKGYDPTKKLYNGDGNTLSIEQLVIGDYIFDNKVCFEFKTANDFIGSIIDGRVFKQSRNMQQYPFSYVIIVGDVAGEINSRNERRYWNKHGNLKAFTVKQYLGAVARLSVDGKVLHCDNQQQAFYLMKSVAEKCLEDTDVKGIDKPSFKLTDPIASFLGCIYINKTSRLSMKQAVLIREHCHLESLQDLLELEYDDLIRINGIGKKTAEAVIEAIR